MNPKVGITIATKNRPHFIIRQLHYYAAVSCPHNIYILDSSDENEAKKIQEEIDELKNKISVIYEYRPELNDTEATVYLAEKVREKYIAIIGDDDFQIPSSLTKCVEFLEANPEYTIAHGHIITIKTKNDSVYGEIIKTKDYPLVEINAETAADRLLEYLSKYRVNLFAVHRTATLLSTLKEYSLIKDRALSVEIFPCCMAVIAGKSKLINCIGFVRQIHSQHYEMPNTFDWITLDNWQSSYKKFEEKLSKALAEKDEIDLAKAKRIVRQSFWSYLQYWLAKDYDSYIHEGTTPKLQKNSLKAKILKVPFAKKMYGKLKSHLNKNLPIHYLVQQKDSPYFKEFSAVRDIITKNY